MIMNVRLRPGQTYGLRIGNEMNLVSPASELKPQFGGDNSAAAVGWITGDANLHAPPTIPIIGFAGRVGDAGTRARGSARNSKRQTIAGIPHFKNRKMGTRRTVGSELCFIQLRWPVTP